MFTSTWAVGPTEAFVKSDNSGSPELTSRVKIYLSPNIPVSDILWFDGLLIFPS